MIVLIALAIAPGLAIAIYVYWRDKFEKDPIYLLLTCFILGALSIMPAAWIETALDNTFHLDEAANLWKTAVESFVFIGLVEEGFKYICLRVFIFNRREFNEPYNGITYAVIISMGFATVENIFYIFPGDESGGLHTALIRAITAVPAHAVNAVMMGYFVGLAKMNLARRKHFNTIGLIVAIFFHGAYDFFLTEKAVPGIAGGHLWR